MPLGLAFLFSGVLCCCRNSGSPVFPISHGPYNNGPMADRYETAHVLCLTPSYSQNKDLGHNFYFALLVEVYSRLAVNSRSFTEPAQKPLT